MEKLHLKLTGQNDEYPLNKFTPEKGAQITKKKCPCFNKPYLKKMSTTTCNLKACVIGVLLKAAYDIHFLSITVKLFLTKDKGMKMK